MIIISAGVVQNSVSSYLIVMNGRIEWNKSREEGYFLPPLMNLRKNTLDTFH